MSHPGQGGAATIADEAQWFAFRGQVETGALIDAWQCVSGWLARTPDDPGAATAQAQLFRLCGRYDDARGWLERALAVAPEHGPALVEAARLAVETGVPDQAFEWFERAHRALPDATDWLPEWATLAHSMRRSDIGVAVCRHWCEREPDCADAWFSLGLIEQQAGALDAALSPYERAMTLDPDLPMLRNNLAALRYMRGEYEAALEAGAEALRADPNHALAWTNMANVWLKLFEPEKALIAARRACTLAPDLGLAQLALSNAARESQQWGEAFEAIVRAAKGSSADPKIQFSVAMLQLMHGDFQNGWINFEARWSGSPELENVGGFCPERRWRGETLSGKTLLIWGEQGHGDAIQFARFLPSMVQRVREAGGTVVCCCFPPLFELFKRSLAGYDFELLPSDVALLPPFDYQLPLASLPLVLGVTLETLPATPSYLLADPARVERWRVRTRPYGDGRLKAGLVWSGSRSHQRNPLRAVSPECYAQALREIDGIDWYSLQVGGAEDAARMTDAGLPIVDRTSELATFDDTAALIGSLDLVVTVCTSVAHLSAALGRPTYLLLDVNPHWVWMTERRDSPWYPAIRLYRQRAYRDWAAPLAELQADLKEAVRLAAVAREAC